MNHKRNTLIALLVLTLIMGLTLVWPAVPAQAGPGLPPRDPIPTQAPPANDKDNHKSQPVGAYIELYAPDMPAGAWAVVQWQDSAGGWHDVEGWQGALPGSSRWWVHPKDFSKGSFRWVVLQGSNGPVLGVGEVFNLPDQANQTVQLALSAGT